MDEGYFFISPIDLMMVEFSSLEEAKESGRVDGDTGPDSMARWRRGGHYAARVYQHRIHAVASITRLVRDSSRGIESPCH